MIRFVKTLLRLAAWACFAIATWLLSVIILVLPRGSANQIPFWVGVMIFFVLYGYLTLRLIHSRIGQWKPLLAVMVVAAIGAGAYALVSEMGKAAHGKDFEGYIILMSLVLIGQSLLLMVDFWLARTLRPQRT